MGIIVIAEALVVAKGMVDPYFIYIAKRYP